MRKCLPFTYIIEAAVTLFGHWRLRLSPRERDCRCDYTFKTGSSGGGLSAEGAGCLDSEVSKKAIYCRCQMNYYQNTVLPRVCPVLPGVVLFCSVYTLLPRPERECVAAAS